MLRPRTLLFLVGFAALLAAGFLLSNPAKASAATVTALVSTSTTANASAYTSGAFTPTAGQLLVAFVVTSGMNDPGAASDTQNLGLSLATSTSMGSGANMLYVYIAQRLAKATSTKVGFAASQGGPA